MSTVDEGAGKDKKGGREGREKRGHSEVRGYVNVCINSKKMCALIKINQLINNQSKEKSKRKARQIGGLSYSFLPHPSFLPSFSFLGRRQTTSHDHVVLILHLPPI
jgi:hypothetical protein